jgi:hypothetical protein
VALIVVIVIGIGVFFGVQATESHSVSPGTRTTSLPNASSTIPIVVSPNSLPRVINCLDAGGPTLKPVTFYVACGDGSVSVTSINWKSWTVAAARGEGTLNDNTCVPDCAQGRWNKVSTAITLTKPVSTRYGQLFTNAIVSALASPAMILPTSSVSPSDSQSTTASSPPTQTTVPTAALTACSRIGGEPRQGGQDNGYILGPTYLNPACLNVPYIGTDGQTYYVNLPLNESGPVGIGSVTGAANETECHTGDYPMANPGVISSGNWSVQLDLCLTSI